MIYSKMTLLQAMNVAYSKLSSKNICVKHSDPQKAIFRIIIISGCFVPQKID
jgi:hypothetical protein